MTNQKSLLGEPSLYQFPFPAKAAAPPATLELSPVSCAEGPAEAGAPFGATLTRP